jgi:hypothetical protein
MSRRGKFSGNPPLRVTCTIGALKWQLEKYENARFASGVIFSSFIVLFTFDGVAILKYTTVVHTSLFTMVSRSQLNIDDNKENFTIEISLS